MAQPLITFGHGRLDREQFLALVVGAGLDEVVDVRRFPGSRTNSAAARGEIPAALTSVGVRYRWDERFGGRRVLDAAADAASPDGWWQVRAFRAYAAWTRTPDFRAALADLVGDITARRTAVLCSESVWWRCHRRIIADVVVLEEGLGVQHLMPDGRLSGHAPSEGVRLDAAGHCVWDRT